MSQQDSNSAQAPLNEQEGASPLPGCIILSAILIVFGGLAVLYTGFAYWMNAQLDGFTSPQPEKVEQPNPSEQQVQAVYAKLKQLKKATESNEMIRVSFNEADINTLIASDPLLADQKGKALVTKIDSEGIHTRVTQQIRSLPMRPDRFLNATIVFYPLVLKESVEFEIRDVKVPGKEVPRGFVEGFSSQGFFRLDSENEHLKSVLPHLRKTYIENNMVIVETGRDPVDE